MTGDPTGVQTMKKKIETVIHLEFGMNNLFVRFFFFFLSLSTILLVTSFGHVPVTPPFY